MNKDFGNKFKNIKNIMKKKKGGDSDEETPDGQDNVFVEADQSMDMMAQARQNLNSFKRYIETNPPDARIHFGVVFQTMTKAFSDITNKGAEIEIKIQESKTQAEEFDTKIEAQEKTKAEIEKTLTELTGQIRTKKNEINKIQAKNDKLEQTILLHKKAKVRVNQLLLKYEDQLSSLNEHTAILEKEKETTAKLVQQLDDAQDAFRCKKIEIENEIKQSEQSLRELVTKVKQVDAVEQKEKAITAATPKKVVIAAPPPEKSTFVIEDNVKVSHSEIDGLRRMIYDIQVENDTLQEELDSKKMDVDCLMQENLGLKQVIREMS